jgi:hypothetical protein
MPTEKYSLCCLPAAQAANILETHRRLSNCGANINKMNALAHRNASRIA